MGLFGDVFGGAASVLTAPVTGGLSLVGLDEDTAARIPVLNTITGAQTDSQKALIKKQQQLAEEAKKRQAANERARMNAIGQQILAFNPLNQTMAQMFGPQAAFSPEQMSQMVADPYARSPEEFAAARAGLKPGQTMQGWSADDIRRMEEDQRRQGRVRQGVTPLGPGPAPLRQVAPQPGRKY